MTHGDEEVGVGGRCSTPLPNILHRPEQNERAPCLENPSSKNGMWLTQTATLHFTLNEDSRGEFSLSSLCFKDVCESWPVQLWTSALYARFQFFAALQEGAARCEQWPSHTPVGLSINKAG